MMTKAYRDKVRSRLIAAWEKLDACTWPPRRVLRSWKYSIKAWAWYRYTTIKPRRLPHTWCDRREIMKHMLFELLETFVEKECIPELLEWYGEYGAKVFVDLPNGRVERFVRDEITELIDWWNNKYHKYYANMQTEIFDEIHELEDKFRICELIKRKDGNWLYDPKYKTPEAAERIHTLMFRAMWLERALADALQKRLHRIINIRQYLWT